MRNFLVIILLFLASGTIFPQDFRKTDALAEKEFNSGNFARSLELSIQALKEAEKDKKATRDDIVELTSDFAVNQFYNDKVDEAINLMVKLEEEAESGSLKQKTRITVFMNYGAMLSALGLYSNSIIEFEKAYDLCKTTEYEKTSVVGITSSLAECNHYLYRFDKAETLYKEALAYCEKNGLTKNVEYPSVYSGMGSLYTDMLFEKKAVSAYEKADYHFRKIQDTASPSYAVFLQNFGTLLAGINQYENSLTMLMRAKSLYEKLYGENSEEYAGILNNLGYTYEHMGRLMETEQFYTRALAIKKSLKNMRFDNYLSSVNNLQYYYSSVGRAAEAAELIEELEKGLQDPRLQDTIKRMTYAENLADYYARNKQYIKAQKYNDEAIKYSKTIYGDNNLEMGNIYMSISVLLLQQNKKARAEEYLRKVPDVIKANSKDAVQEITSLIRNYAVILSTHLGRHAEAEPFINESIKLVNNKTITGKNEVADIYCIKAEISADLEKISTAIEYFNKYLDLKYAQMEEDFKYMTEAEKLQFLESFELETKNFFSTISNHVQKYPELIQLLLNFRIQTKSMLLNNLSKIKKSIAQLNDPVLNEKFEKMKLDRENISKLMSLNTDEYAAALSEVSALKTEADQYEKEISAKVSAASFSGYQKIKWQEIQKQLAPNECAIEIVRTNMVYLNDSNGTNYSFIVLKNSGTPAVVMFDRQQKWEEEVLMHYRNTVSGKNPDPDLYRRLWKAIRDQTGTATTIYVSSDGIYNQINLNTIYNPETKKFIIEECNVHYVTTLRDLMNLKSNPSHTPSNVALVGNPVFNYDLSKLSENKENFGNDIAVRGAFGFKLDQLPGTKREIETIHSQLNKQNIKTTVLTEEKANEADVKKIKNPHVLHFATHGFFLEDIAQETLNQLSKTERAYYTNPMMRSGVFLSGANNTYSLNTTNINRINEFEDGTLTAYEVMNLDLDKTELVVLSACETGLGKVKNGEGVFGLQRAFKLAGAKSVIMSLWSVSDEATMELMINFYSKWVEKGDIYAAFKDAQLEVKKKYPEPYYWGAFVLNGR